MKIASVADVKTKFSAYLRACQKGPVVVTKNGRPVAALVPILDEDELEDLVLAYSPRFQAIIQQAEQQIQRKEGVPSEEFWHQVESESSV